MLLWSSGFWFNTWETPARLQLQDRSSTCFTSRKLWKQRFRADNLFCKTCWFWNPVSQQGTCSSFGPEVYALNGQRCSAVETSHEEDSETRLTVGFKAAESELRFSFLQLIVKEQKVVITNHPKHQLAFSVSVLLSARLLCAHSFWAQGAEPDGNGDLICINDNHMERVCVIYCSSAEGRGRSWSMTSRLPRKDSQVSAKDAMFGSEASAGHWMLTGPRTGQRSRSTSGIIYVLLRAPESFTSKK